MGLDALLACLNGVGADWRRGGFAEGGAQLSRAQLSTVMAAQVSRMQASAATPRAGAGGWAGLEAAAVGGGEALMQLMRSKWDVTKAVRATLETRQRRQQQLLPPQEKSHPQRPAQPVQPRQTHRKHKTSLSAGFASTRRRLPRLCER